MRGVFLPRLLSACVVVVGVCSLVFLLIHLVPGDPVEVILGESSQPADRAALRAALGLDQPLLVQYGHYLQQLAHLDLGQSLHSRKPVADLLSERLPATFELAVAALAVAILMAVPLGIIAALNRDRAGDHIAMSFAMLGVSIPNFWMGPILILAFSLWLGWLPVSGREIASSLILPAFTLGTGMAAILSRMIRTTLLDVLGEDYIRTARALGLGRGRIILHHALKNTLLPVLTLIGLQLGALLAGAVITEIVFSWPGIGQLTIEAIQRRDYPVLQGCVLLISLTYVSVNTLTDLVTAWFDPRIRLRGD